MEFLDRMPASPDQVAAPSDARIVFSALAQKPPAAFIDRLRAAFASQTDIAAGYLWQMQVSGGAPHLVAGVQFAQPLLEDDIKNAMNWLGDSVSPLLPPGEYMDFIVIQGEHNLPVMLLDEARFFRRV